MKAKKYLEYNFGITFTKIRDEFHNEITDEWIKSMEDYADYKFKIKVDAISDEDIEFKTELAYPSLDKSHQIAFRSGAKWFKNKLLKQ